MAVLQNTFDGGVEGVVPIATTNVTSVGYTGGRSGSPLDLVNVETGGTVQFGRVGTRKTLRVVTGGTPVNGSYVEWNSAVTTSRLWGRAYVYLSAYPAATAALVRFFRVTTNLASLAVTSAGKLVARDQGNTVVLTSATTLPLSQWVRIEWDMTYSTTVGQIEFKIFTSADSSTATETLASPATLNLGFTQVTKVQFGAPSNVVTPEVHFDSIGVNDGGYLGPGPVTVVRSMMPEMKVIDRTAAIASEGNIEAVLGLLPDWQSISVTFEDSDIGALTFEYPTNGTNASLLTTPFEVALFIDGFEVRSGRFMVSEQRKDRAPQAAVGSYAGESWVGRLQEILAYPDNWPSTPYAYVSSLTAPTPGGPLNQLLARAVTRGSDAASKMGHGQTWGAVFDSTGLVWTTNITAVAYLWDYKTTGWDLLQSVQQKGFLEYETRGRYLYLYSGTARKGVDRTAQTSPVLLSSGKDVQEAPESISAKELRTVALLEGADGVLVERTNAAGVTAYGRRDVYVKEDKFTATADLNALGDAVLGFMAAPRREISVGITVVPGQPLPMLDYAPGDSVWVDLNGTIEKYKVKQIRLTFDKSGSITGSVTLNDRIDLAEVTMNQRLNQIQPGEAQSFVPVEPSADDPSAVTKFVAVRGTSNVTPITTTPVVVVTAPSITLVAGKTYQATGCVRGFTSTVLGDRFGLRLMAGGVQYQEVNISITVVNINHGGTTYDVSLLAGTDIPAGATVFTMECVRTAGTGTGTVAGSAIAPASLVVKLLNDK